jgi:hypothetical protein
VRAHPAEPCYHIKAGAATKKLKTGADMAFFNRAVTEEVHSVIFRSDQELKALTRVLGRFWNIAPHKTQMPSHDRFRPHLNMNIKVIHPRISTADVTNYRRKKRKDGDGTGTTGSECRRPGASKALLIGCALMPPAKEARKALVFGPHSEILQDKGDAGAGLALRRYHDPFLTQAKF